MASPTKTEMLEEVLAAGRAAWPELAPDPKALAAMLSTMLADRGTGEALTQALAAELYLAAACAIGDAPAQNLLDSEYLQRTERAVRRVATGGQSTSEIIQALRLKLLTGDGEALPKIALYRARGPLGGWIRVTALRLALRQTNDEALLEREDGMLEQRSAGIDVEMAYLKLQHAQDFKLAFRDALESLDPKARSLMRLHLVSGLSLEQIGEQYGVDQSTTSRWLKAARLTLRSAVEAKMRDRLKMNRDELESLFRQIYSQLSISLTEI